MTALTDEQTLLDFVIWRIRSSDLPPDVREAAVRLSVGIRRPDYLRGIIRYTEGPLQVSGYYAGTDEREQHRRCYPHQIGRVVQALLDEDCTYILIQDL